MNRILASGGISGILKLSDHFVEGKDLSGVNG